MMHDTKDTIIKPFMNGRSQAIRIPSEFRYKMNEELYINKIGDTLIVTPKKSLKNTFEKSLSLFSDDFMEEGRPEESSNERRMKEVKL